MKKQFAVTALGELLIDMTTNGLSSQGNQTFEANPGGAPCNVLSLLSKLGHSTAFLGKVGDDHFGRTLQSTIAGLGIDVGGLVLDSHYNTTLAIATLDESGDRSFSFYREPGADMMLRVDELNMPIIKDSQIFHYGSLSMTHPQVREATHAAVDYAKSEGLLRSFDPNYRPPLWKSQQDAVENMMYGIKNCDILKISNYELTLISGSDNLEHAARAIMESYGIRLLLLTYGKDGCQVFTPQHMVSHHAFPNVQTVDTTGAGDTFMGYSLHMVLQGGLDNLDESCLLQLARCASAASALVTTRRGALLSMPTSEEIDHLIATY